MAQGHKTGGRKKGTPNKKSQDISERLETLNCDPIEGMARIASQAEKEKNFQLAGSMYKELANYIYPKRKSVDYNQSSNVRPILQIITGIDRELFDA